MNQKFLIEIYSVLFHKGIGSKAIELRDYRNDLPVGTKSRPEWLKDTHIFPAAYERGTTVKVKVVFFMQDSTGGKYKMGAHGNLLDIREKEVELEFNGGSGSRGGISEPVEFEFDSPLPDRIGLHNIKLSWYFSPHQESGFPGKRFTMGESSHTVCTTWKCPQKVQDELDGWVYTVIMEWTCQWAAGKTNEKEICDAIIGKLYSTGLQYGVSGWQVRGMLLGGGGWCGGWAKLFQAMANSQGVYVHHYFFSLEWRTNFFGRDNQAAWCALVNADGGQNQASPTDPPAVFHDNTTKFPIPREEEVPIETTAETRYRFFSQPDSYWDGHCINFLEYENKLYLYDPSFGTGPFGLDMKLPESNPHKAVGGEELASFKANYLDKAFKYLLGSSYNGKTLYKTIVYNNQGQLLLVPQNGMTVETKLIPDVIECENGEKIPGITLYWI
jgi:hypothetical protein